MTFPQGVCYANVSPHLPPVLAARIEPNKCTYLSESCRCFVINGFFPTLLYKKESVMALIWTYTTVHV